jgi:hypothetical protein
VASRIRLDLTGLRDGADIVPGPFAYLASALDSDVLLRVPGEYQLL